jgi:uncharacterized protein (DUF305 family)
MNRITAVRRALLAGALMTTAFVLAAGCGTSRPGGMGSMEGDGHPASASKSGSVFSAADVQFAQSMIPHHQQAVDAAVLAETRANDPEVKQLAAQIKSAQEPEIKTMTAWLTAWGQPVQAVGGRSMPSGSSMPGMSGMPGMGSDDETAALTTATGVDFDRKFVRMMIAHHNNAIVMSHSESTNGLNPDTIALAVRIEKTQSAEVAKLQKIIERL